MWAEKYSGTTDDIFEIQENVSRSIAEALNLKLTKEEKLQLSQHPIQDAKAHECYLRARQEIWKFTEQGLDNAITLAQRGLDMVGENGVLYATLSMAHLFIQHYGIQRDPYYLENAYKYAAKSLELDADSLPALFVQGTLSLKKGNLQEAANTYKKILDKDQNFPEALQFLTVCCFLSGNPKKGWPYTKRPIQVNPLTLLHHGFPGFIELFDGNFVASLPYHQKLLQMDPNSPFTRYWCAIDFALSGNLEDSINVLDTMAKDTPNMIFGKFALFLKSDLQGDTENALKHATNELREEAALLDYMPLFMAYGYALIGKAEEALWWLNKSLDFGYSPYPLLLKWETIQRVLKDHPAFQTYIKEIKRRSEQFDV